MSILEELYHESIRGFDSRLYSDGSPYKEAIRKRQDAQDKGKVLILQGKL